MKPSSLPAFPAHVPDLSTRRLLLRPLVDDDADAIFGLFADPQAMRYWSTPAWTDPAEALRLVARDRAASANGEAIRFGLVERGSAGVIGCCSLHRVDAGNRRAEVGYILRRDRWGLGLMNEALECVLDFAFDTLRLHRLEADIDPRNAASARSLERLGFRREGFMRGRWIVGGEICDSAFYGLLQADRANVARREAANDGRIAS